MPNLAKFREDPDAMLVMALRNRGDSEDPRATAMLIAGMMVTAFGLLLAGFAIAFAASAHPKVTIVVPTYGQPEYTARCLRSVQDAGARGSFAAALTRASRERLMPGAMIPPL